MATEDENRNSFNVMATEDEYLVYDKNYFKQSLHHNDLNRILVLKNGCRIAIGEVGKKDGFPVFFFPGLGGTRHFLVFFEKSATLNGLRLISPDRHGTGLSDDIQESSEKQPLSWASVVEEIADQLNIDRFGLCAQSGGAIFALACAIKIPHRIVGTIHILSPWVDLATPGSSRRWKAAKWVPSSLIRVIWSIMGVINASNSSGSSSKHLSKTEKHFYDTMFLPFFDEYLQIAKDENESGSIFLVLLCLGKLGSWGFRYEDVELPVHCHHGDKDTMVPLPAVQAMSSGMKRCELTIYADATHDMIMDLHILETILKNLAESVKSC